MWQHSYMETLPVTNDVKFYSDHYRPCTTRAFGWCNIPRFSDATEQMIVAYHKGTVVYTYNGLFNRNIDYNCSGAILLTSVNMIMVFSHPPTNMMALHLTNTHHITILQIVIHITGLFQITKVTVAGKLWIAAGNFK